MLVDREGGTEGSAVRLADDGKYTSSRGEDGKQSAKLHSKSGLLVGLAHRAVLDAFASFSFAAQRSPVDDATMFLLDDQ